MKKTKVENISGLKLDFFLKQNKEDIRVVLKPGESSWCDHKSNTKSMILYERKNLIKSSEYLSSNTIIDEAAANINNDEILDNLHTTESISSIAFEVVPAQAMKEPNKELFLQITSDLLTPLEKAKKETEEYKKESEKTYKGKKRGRKKKRGPKPGSKRKKGGSANSPESPAQ